MIRWLVLHVGRTGTVLLLISGSFLVVRIIYLIYLAAAGQAGIDPNEALPEGGHIVTVTVSPGAVGGRYEVKTLSGRPPKQRSGEFTDDINVVVGPDWIGQIKVIVEGYCKGIGNVAWSAISDPIGGDFGWDEQDVYVVTGC